MSEVGYVVYGGNTYTLSNDRFLITSFLNETVEACTPGRRARWVHIPTAAGLVQIAMGPGMAVAVVLPDDFKPMTAGEFGAVFREAADKQFNSIVEVLREDDGAAGEEEPSD